MSPVRQDQGLSEWLPGMYGWSCRDFCLSCISASLNQTFALFVFLSRIDITKLARAATCFLPGQPHNLSSLLVKCPMNKKRVELEAVLHTNCTPEMFSSAGYWWPQT